MLPVASFAAFKAMSATAFAALASDTALSATSIAALTFIEAARAFNATVSLSPSTSDAMSCKDAFRVDI